MFLTLENLGFRGRVSFLNGGLEGWKREDYPVTTVIPASGKGNVKLTFGNLIVDKEYVLKSLQSESALVVDARMKNYYDGDETGNQDFVIDRQENPQRLEAYRHDGTFMWEVNFGPNSANQDNISPGSATVDVGHNDGVTVYDLNGDGRSEVVIKIANGVRFAQGQAVPDVFDSSPRRHVDRHAADLDRARDHARDPAVHPARVRRFGVHRLRDR